MGGIYKTPDGEAAIHAMYRRFIAHWPAPRQEMLIPTREGETFVIASGPEEAPALVLLHGSAFNSVAWMGDVAAWAQHFRVYAVDVIGEPGFSAPSRPKLASDAHALWLDDVMAGLGLERAAFAGMSLGGWLALDYATRRPERVEKLVLIAPGGLAKNRNVAIWAIPLTLIGKWGQRKLVEAIAGPQPAEPSPALRAVQALQSAIFRTFRPRTAPLRVTSDAALRRLSMPVLAILGAKDVFIRSALARRRLEAHAPRGRVIWLPEGRHAILGQTAPILEFLRQT